jgi:hypothetical protein
MASPGGVPPVARGDQRASPSTGLRHRRRPVDEGLVQRRRRLVPSSPVPTLALLAGVLGMQWLALGVLAPPAPARAGQTPATVALARAPGAPPVVRAVALSRSLHRVLRNGLVVRYAVDEEVAGHFEVLLARSLARRIGLRGSAPRGLAAGATPQVVIGRASLITIAGGRDTLKLHFGRASVVRLRRAARLHRLGRLPLTLRLVVRNTKSPASTAVLSHFTLSA